MRSPDRDDRTLFGLEKTPALEQAMNKGISHQVVEVSLSIAAVLFGVSTAFYLIPTQVVDPSQTIPNARTFPYVVTWLFNLLCCIWVILAIIRLKNTEASSALNVMRCLVIGTAFIALFAAINSAGYIIGGVLAVAGVIVAIDGMRRWLMALCAGTIITFAYGAFFGSVLHIEIPAGLLRIF